MTPSAHLEALSTLLGEVDDILLERVLRPTPPGWAERRGWSGFLLGLDDFGKHIQPLMTCRAGRLPVAV